MGVRALTRKPERFGHRLAELKPCHAPLRPSFPRRPAFASTGRAPAAVILAILLFSQAASAQSGELHIGAQLGGSSEGPSGTTLAYGQLTLSEQWMVRAIAGTIGWRDPNFVALAGLGWGYDVVRWVPEVWLEGGYVRTQRRDAAVFRGLLGARRYFGFDFSVGPYAGVMRVGQAWQFVFQLDARLAL